MTIELLTAFFQWCVIINAGIFVLWTVCFLCCPDYVYRTQSKFFPISREAFNLIFYCFLGLFKIFFLFFNVVPWVVLLIIG